MPSDRRPLAIFAAASAAFLLSMFYRVSITVVSPQLATELGLSAAELSVMSSAFFYVFALVQPGLGAALDRMGPRVLMSGLGLTAAGGALLFALAESGDALLLARILMGLGMSANFTGSLMLIMRWFPANRFATLSGALSSLGTLGMTLASTPLALLARSLGWRGAFLALAGVTVLQVALFLWVVRNQPSGTESGPRPRPRGNPFRDLGLLARRPFFWIMGAATFFRFGAFMAITGLWAGPYLMQGMGLDPVAAGNMLLAASLGYILVPPLAGRASDHLLRSRKWVIAPSLLVLAALLALLATLDRSTPLPLLAGLFLLLGAASAPGQVIYAHIKELTPPDIAGTALSGANLFNMLGPAILLQAAGLLLPADLAALGSPEPFARVWLFFAAGVGATGLLYLLVPESPALRRGLRPAPARPLE